MHKPLIALTNDDGIASPGLRALAEGLCRLGEIMIVAPREQQSSMGRGLWGDRSDCLHPLEYLVAGQPVTAYYCNASPALTTLHAMHVLFTDRRPDLLVTGINYGENLGLNVTLSGTVGAALEAASHGVPALAVSLQTDIAYHYRYGAVDWRAASHFARLFAAAMLRTRLPFDVDLLKVDVPRDATADTPWRVTRASRQSYFSVRMESPAPHNPIGAGKVVVHLDPAAVETDSDIHAIVYDRIVSVTPLTLDLTSRVDRADLDALLRSKAL